MSALSMHYCALQYLNYWLEFERGFAELFPASSWESAAERNRLALKAATYFKVSRNVSIKFGVKEAPEAVFGRLLALLDSVDTASVDADPVSAVYEVHEAASKIVGRNVLSLVTKFLWLKEKSPVRIFDSLARKALDVPEISDRLQQYSSFCTKWNDRYQQVEGSVIVACAELPALGRFTVDPETATVEYLVELTSDVWFRHRVFDIYLWRGGRSEDE